MVLQQIWREFEKCMEELDQSKMCQISMDGPSVNWKFFSSVTKKREEDELPALINIGSCGLHVIHGAFKTGVKATNWNIKKFCVVHSTFCMILQRDEKTMKVLQVAQNIL